MACCKCEEFGWDDPQQVEWTDPEDGREYCLFHAPADKKMIGGELCAAEMFNERVFARVQFAIDESDIKICNLCGTIFPDTISFSRYGRKKPLPAIWFNKTQFMGIADFSSTEFNGPAVFHSTTFHQFATFHSATFSSYAAFSSAIFHNNANFDSAIFNDHTDFSSTTFCISASFFSASFNGYANFESTQFMKTKGYLSFMIFNGTEFDEVVFHQACFEQRVMFNNCQFGSKKLRFIKTDVTQCDFLETEMTDIEFINVCWPKANEDKRLPHKWREGRKGLSQSYNDFGWNSRYKIPLEDDPDRLQQVRDFYQTMKRIYKDKHDEYEASKWHVAEKEAHLRLLTQNGESPFLRALLILYKWVSGYGEVPSRAVSMLIGLILLAWLLLGGFGISDEKTVIQGISLTWEGIQNFGTTFITLFKNVMLFKESAIAFKPVEGWVYGTVLVLTRLLIPIQAALFAMAVRNKMRR